MIGYIFLGQLRLILKNPKLILLFTITPLLLIYILGTVLDQTFASSPGFQKALDYFGRTFLGMAVMYGSTLSGWAFSKERTWNTMLRHNVSPLGACTVTAGLFLSGWVSVAVLTGISGAAGHFLFGLNLGRAPGLLILLLLMASLFSASFGLLISALVPDAGAGLGLMSGILPVFIFLGGGYIPLPEYGVLHTLSALSPLTWIYECMDSIYDGIGPGPMGTTAFVLLSCSLVFLALAAAIIGKRGLK